MGSRGGPWWLLGVILVGVLLALVLILNLFVKLFSKDKTIQPEPPSPLILQHVEQPIEQRSVVEQRPIINVSPTLIQNNTQTQSQHQSQQHEYADTPRFSATARIERWYLNTEIDQLIEEEWGSVPANPNLVPVHVALARFYFLPDGDTYPHLDITAHIFARDRNGTSLEDIYKTVWRDAECRAVKFDQTDDNDLIVAIIGEGVQDAICLYEFREMQGRRLNPRPKRCNGTEFSIRIQLVGQWYGGAVRYNHTFEVPITLVPGHRIGTIRQID